MQLVAGNRAELQVAVNIWKEGIGKVGLKININKTKTIRIGQEAGPYSTKINQK